jgi:hypothetical protein
MTDTPDTAPVWLRDLTQGEHLLLWAFRAAAFGKPDCPIVRRTYDMSCGFAGLEALSAIKVFVSELRRRGRREVKVALPGTFALSRDEQLLISVFAAAQAQDYARMEAHLIWLTGRDAGPPFGAAACLVAEALGMSGFVLRLPPIAGGTGSPVLEVWDGGEAGYAPNRRIDRGAAEADSRRAPL